ncbi:PREDICTED: O-acyltransferase WSD1-like [Camelina sativa]|uniref:O-acyltransferase WSD1-like n=1 Tax=Camelina sativa TaxID=90675 RepID=A0ABM0VBM7_CAMSA|nr:PREDICTED: O-acyltransferase WSD1-like [Camelina sativa]
MHIGNGRMENKEEDEEPLSPMARVFQSPDIDICAIINIGFKTKINPDVVLDALRHNVYKHPRFSSKLSENGAKWIETEVNVEDHVVVPYIDLEETCEGGQRLVDDYCSRLTMTPLDRSRPLWDIHILNVKTSDAEAVGVIRFNHALADGMSFISLVLACTHKTSNPNMLSTATPLVKRRTTVPHSLEKTGWFLRAIFTIGSTMRLIWNTIVDVLLLVATVLFLKDTKTPLKGNANVRRNPRRFYHRTISLDDIKLIKNAMNMTINDVLLGITQAALSSYMNRQYLVSQEQDKNDELEDGSVLTSYLPDGIRFRAGCTVNLRPDIGFKPLAEMMVKDSKCRWGNYFSFIILPLSIALETDPLVYLEKSKAIMARKKHSYQAALAYFFINIILKVLGAKAASLAFNQHLKNITTCVSNVMGPMEEISFHGHPIAYISPSSYGHSQALLIHYTSYAGEVTITVGVNPTVVPDPHKICDDMEESLKTMKAVLRERGLL